MPRFWPATPESKPHSGKPLGDTLRSNGSSDPCRQLYEILPFLHPSPDLRGGTFDRHFSSWPDRDGAASDQRISRGGTPHDRRDGHLSGGQSEDLCADCCVTRRAGLESTPALTL